MQATASNILEEVLSPRLLGQEAVAAVKGWSGPGTNLKALVSYLRKEGYLTEFQAKLILQDGIHELFCSSYTVLDIVGKGSFGNVYKVRRHETGQLFAMKVLSERNPTSIGQYQQQLQEFSRYRSRNIVPLVHIFARAGKTSLVWPFVDKGQFGETLEDVIRQEGPLHPRDTILVGLQIVKSLARLHELGLFHGLLKPSNLLVTSQRSVRLLDFGIGFLLSVGRNDSLLDTITHAKQIASNLDCSSPETICDSSMRNPASDRYSLGCILYLCLTGQYPFPVKHPVKKMLAHQQEEPQPVRDLCPDVPPVLAGIVHQLLEKDPTNRFSDTNEVLSALEGLRRSVRIPTTKPQPYKPPMPAQDRVPAGATLDEPEPDETPESLSLSAFQDLLASPWFWGAMIGLGGVLGVLGAWLVQSSLT